MRLVGVLIFALALSIALIVFPDIADQALRIEAFGWLFETRQGAFIVALLLLLLLLWLMRSALAVLFAGPGMIWQSLRLGSRKRREKKLQEALGQCLDQRGDAGAKALKRCRGVVPDWALDMLRALVTPAHRLAAPSAQQHALSAVLAARIATNPYAQPKLELSIRKAHLETWLELHPGAPLALSRMADLLEEEGDWARCVELLEAELKHAHSPAESVKSRLLHAYLELSQQEPDDAIVFLRKAYRLQPEHEQVLLAYGQALLGCDDAKAAQRLWAGHLDRISSDAIAQALLKLQRPDALRAYRQLEGKQDALMSLAQRWLRAELAHAAKLDGLAFEQMQALASEDSYMPAWHSLGVWHQSLGDYKQAASCLRTACEMNSSS